MALSMRFHPRHLPSAFDPGNAAILKLRTSTPLLLSTALSCQCRSFSSAQRKAAHAQARGAPSNRMASSPPQPSMKTRSKGISRGNLPQDFGVLPGTFIRPLWRDMPSIFKQPRERLFMEWLSLKVSFQNFVGCVFSVALDLQKITNGDVNGYNEPGA